VSEPRDYRLIVEKDVAIPMRDGAVLFADVFRPDAEERCPAIMNISVYQKDKLWVPPPDLEEEANPYMNWETVNPLWWVPRGYACVRVDARGSGKSHGASEPNSYQEAVDFYDAIEWIARRPWCSGSIGTCGISYHANSQWRVAGLQPPSLKAILPWEGRADMYRDQAYHGGIFSMEFVANWANNNTAHHLLGAPASYNPDAFRNDLLWEWMRHSLDSDYWRTRGARWDCVTVPLYSAGNWGGFALHLRGNTEGFTQAASLHKKLRIHDGTRYHLFYSEEGRMDQLRWFDYWLKGLDTGIMDEPPVKLLIRTGDGQPYQWRFENEWPIARTQWTRMYLKSRGEAHAAAAGELVETPPVEVGKLSYAASSPPGHAVDDTHMGVAFETAPMAEDIEITGPIVLVLWVSSTSKDMDIFATIRNIGPDGQDCWEVGQQGNPVPVAKGWLRASHRKLDPVRSLPYRPFHAHDERLWLNPDEVVECHVEIWPSCMVFRKGHRLRLDVQPRDGVGSERYRHYSADYNAGAQNTIYAGGAMPSYLLLPVIPPR